MHYVHLIEKEIVVTDELIQACKQIYLNHKTAIDLIIEHGIESPISQAFSEFFEANNQLSVLSIRSNTAYFVYQDWDINNWALKSVKKYGWRFDFPVLLWFDLSKPKKLVMYLEVGPVPDNDDNLRSHLIRSLRSHLHIPDTPKGHGATFTRITKYEAVVPEEPTQAELCNAMKSAFDKAKQDSIKSNVEVAMKDLAGSRQQLLATK